MNETFKDRQERENREHYEKWLSCGFTGEMSINQYGWCDNALDKTQVTEITVFEKGYQYRARIHYAQLPNSKWVAASDMFCATHGYGSAVGIWDKQYDTKEEAVTAELDKVERALEKNDQKPFVLKGIEKCRKEFKKKSTTVFDIDPEFYYGKNFQQTSLFFQETALF